MFKSLTFASTIIAALAMPTEHNELFSNYAWSL